jgi:hypothetical protein
MRKKPHHNPPWRFLVHNYAIRTGGASAPPLKDSAPPAPHRMTTAVPHILLYYTSTVLPHLGSSTIEDCSTHEGTTEHCDRHVCQYSTRVFGIVRPTPQLLGPFFYLCTHCSPHVVTGSRTVPLFSGHVQDLCLELNCVQ